MEGPCPFSQEFKENLTNEWTVYMSSIAECAIIPISPKDERWTV